MSGIVLKASVNIRMRKGKARFPKGSFAAILSPARTGLVRDVERSFAGKVDPVTGRPWPERKHDYPWPPLVQTGAMRSTALQAAASAVVNGNTLTATVRRPKQAIFQQKGTRTIAARRFLGASISTIKIVHAGLVRAGKEEAVRVLRGKA